MPHSNTNRPIISRTVGQPSLPAIAVALLAGMSLVTLCASFTECAYLTMDTSPLTFQLSVAASMLATAMGPICLARIVLSFKNLTSNGSKPNAESASQNLPASYKHSEDWELRWMVTAVVAMVGCVLILGTPEIFEWVHRVKAIVVKQFLWATLSVSALEGVVLFVIAAAPFSFLGLLVRCVHQVSSCDGRWHLATGAWFLVGAAVGCLIFMQMSQLLGDPFLMMRLACGPLVLAALVSTWQVSRNHPLHKHLESDTPAEPEFGQRWPTVLRLAVAVILASVVCACVVWVYVASTVRFDDDVAMVACSALFLSAAAGVLWANRRGCDANELVGVFGQSAVGAGITLAGAVAVFNLVLRESDAPFVQSPACMALLCPEASK